MVGDVLDTSRIEAGTFTYSFGDVDLAELVRETASMIEVATDEVKVSPKVVEPLPPVRGDRDRPRAFESTPDRPTTIWVFKRVQPKD